VSCGLVNGQALLDLAYVEDSIADADVNVVQTLGGDLVEVQGTAEGAAFPREQLDRLLDLASIGNTALIWTPQSSCLAQALLKAWQRLGRQRSSLGPEQRGVADASQVEQSVELLAREGGAFGRACTSTRSPPSVWTTLTSASAIESSTYARSSSAWPLTRPQLTAATGRDERADG